MTTEPELGQRRDGPVHADEFDREWIAQHIEEERKHTALLGEMREIVFGAQDGLISTLAVVATVGAATQSGYAVAVAGIATALGGVFSMGAGEYMSSRSQRDIFEAQIARERAEVAERPGESEAEVRYMLEEEGLSPEAARRVARELAGEPEVLLKTMVEKELKLIPDEEATPLQGALFMGASFGVASLVPILPYLFLPVSVAVWLAIAATALALFGIGVVKSRWTEHHFLRSGAEIVGLGAAAGVAGYLFGSILPGLLGVTGLAG